MSVFGPMFPSYANVNSTLSTAPAGSTILLAAGTGTDWTNTLTISKSIIIKGVTTVHGVGVTNGTGTPPGSAPTVDAAQTIIQSGTGGPIFTLNVSKTDAVDISGITFEPGASQSGQPVVSFNQIGDASTPNKVTTVGTGCRFHHNFLNNLWSGDTFLTNGWIYPLIDHNWVISRDDSRFVANEHCGNYNNNGTFGSGSFNDPPFFGSNNFTFLEDNSIFHASPINGLWDGIHGSRIVGRYNFVQEQHVSGHGTESSVRGHRCHEFYRNIVNSASPGLWGARPRRGSCLWHDNQFYGVALKSPASCCNFQNFRQYAGRPDPSYGISYGVSPWDINDTTPSGTYTNCKNPQHVFVGVGTNDPRPSPSPITNSGVTGNSFDYTITLAPPHPSCFFFAWTNIPAHQSPTARYWSGTCTAPETPVNSTGTLGQAGAGWATNQWVGFSVINTAQPASNGSPGAALGGYIISNTSTQITYAYGGAGSRFAHFNPTDTFEIRRVIIMMDQCGRGRCLDNIVFTTSQSQTFPTIASTGLVGPFPRQQWEPLYSWNNFFVGLSYAGSPGSTNGTIVPFTGHDVNSQGQGQPTTQIGCDVLNISTVQAVMPANPPPSAVTTAYNMVGIDGSTTINGTNYTGDFTYPHPAISGVTPDPIFTSPNQATFTTGIAGQHFDVTTSGFSGTPTITLETFFPSTPTGISFNPTFAPNVARFTGDTGSTAQSYQVLIDAAHAGDASIQQAFTLFIQTGVSNIPPTISISTNGTVFTTAQVIIVTTVPADQDGNVTQVIIKDNGVQLGPTLTGPPWTYSGTFAQGTHVFTAVATDNQGANSTVATAPTVTVNPVVVTATPPSSIVLNVGPSIPLPP